MVTGALERLQQVCGWPGLFVSARLRAIGGDGLQEYGMVYISIYYIIYIYIFVHRDIAANMYFYMCIYI